MQFKTLTALGTFLALLVPIAQADFCPPPPTSIEPSMRSEVRYDKKSQLYRYKYTMRNGPGAQVPIEFFGIEINQAPTSVLSAPHWSGSFAPLLHAPSAFNWSTIEIANPDIVDDKADIPPALFPIRVGSSMTGFEITSPNPPGVVPFFAEGFTQPPSATPTEENDEPIPNCPDWDFEGINRVYGMTIGPSDPNTVDVRIRVRKDGGLHAFGPIRPKSPKGKISVLVFSSRVFDASQINVSSVIFGPGFASPIASKLVPAGVGEKVNSDERTEWEKTREEVDRDWADRKDNRRHNLLLTFNLASLDIQCKLDQALFLRGKTNTGQHFVGAVPAHLAGCGPKEIGKHKRTRFPYIWWKRDVSR